MSKRITYPLKRRCVALVASGVSITDVAAQMKLNRSTVYAWCEWAGVPRRQRPSLEERASAVARVAAGESMRSVAKSIGVDPGSLHYWCTLANVRSVHAPIGRERAA